MGYVFSQVENILRRMFPHRRQLKLQRVVFNEMIATLEEGHVLIIADFQKRYTHHEQDEAQSQDWNKNITTLFPASIFFHLVGFVRTYSFVVLTDESLQNNAWVQYTFKRLLQTEIADLWQRVVVAPVTRMTFFTDNFGKQFKCSHSFGFTARCTWRTIRLDRST